MLLQSPEAPGENLITEAGPGGLFSELGVCLRGVRLQVSFCQIQGKSGNHDHD